MVGGRSQLTNGEYSQGRSLLRAGLRSARTLAGGEVLREFQKLAREVGSDTRTREASRLEQCLGITQDAVDAASIDPERVDELQVIVGVLQALGAYQAAESLRSRCRSALLGDPAYTYRDSDASDVQLHRAFAALDVSDAEKALTVIESAVKGAASSRWSGLRRHLALLDVEGYATERGAGFARQDSLRRYIQGREIELVGPQVARAERRKVTPVDEVATVWLKFVGIDQSDPAGDCSSPHLSYVNASAYTEMDRRLAGVGASEVARVLGRCRLFCFKGTAPPRVHHFGVETRKIDGVCATWSSHRLLGLWALCELVATGSPVLLAGVDLHTTVGTHDPEYPLFSAHRSRDGGLSHLDVCITHGFSDVFSQWSLLRNLRERGRISVDARLADVLGVDQPQLAAHLQRIHGVPSWLEDRAGIGTQ